MRLFFWGGTTVSPELILRAHRHAAACPVLTALWLDRVPDGELGYDRPEDAHYGAETTGRSSIGGNAHRR